MAPEPESRWIPASFVARPNRFIVRAALDDGSEVDAHLPDPGRLQELLLPDARLRLQPAPPDQPRKTAYTVRLVQTGKTWVSVDTGRANALAAELLADGQVRGVPRGLRLRREVRCGASRLDFLLEDPREAKTWVEVKSVTLVEGGVALFPDAPTARGRRHVDELARRAGQGDRAIVLFVAQRADAREVRPHRGIDPLFAERLRAAADAGVLMRACRFRLTASGRADYEGPVPVRLDPPSIDG